MTEETSICPNLASELPKMRDLARKAFKEAVEYGAAINADWKLGEPIKGRQHQVSIPRPPDGKGSYHTHFVEVEPSLTDFWEMLLHQEQAMCIGKAKIANPEVQCSFPQRPDDFKALGLAVQIVQERLDSYTKGLEAKYGKAIAKTELERLEGLALLRTVRGLKDSMEHRKKDIISGCKME